jgi:hypothetical protein
VLVLERPSKARRRNQQSAISNLPTLERAQLQKPNAPPDLSLLPTIIHHHHAILTLKLTL